MPDWRRATNCCIGWSEVGDSLVAVPAWLADALVVCGLAAEPDCRSIVGQPLTGGVSSDIWVAHLAGALVCVKRALPRLKVAAVWEAPIERSASEAAWLARAERIDAQAVPPMLGYDPGTGAIVLGWLDPTAHPQWKAQLLEGHVDPSVAAALGDRLGCFHAGMTAAADPSAPADFDHLDLFDALRLEPYFGTTATVHPALRNELRRLREWFSANAVVVVHGDVSPKNVLVGPHGPVLLDAECACWGDPAFDPAFLLTHLLLKARHQPAMRESLQMSADAFWSAYVAHVDWEDRVALEGRVAAYWPALVLARVDGASPVEYLDLTVRDAVRADVLDFVARPRSSRADLDPLWSTT